MKGKRVRGKRGLYSKRGNQVGFHLCKLEIISIMPSNDHESLSKDRIEMSVF